MPVYDDDDFDDRPAPRRRRHDDEDDGDDRRRRRRRWGDEDDHDFRKRDLPHSGVGIASCAVAVLAILAGVGAMTLAAAGGIDDIEAAIEAEEPVALAAGVLMLGSGLLALIGGVLAIAGLAQGDRNKLFAVMGLCFNAMLFFCGLGLMILGSLAE
jgi:hypothetical protein